MQHARLLSLRIDHAGYEGGFCPDLSLDPAPASQRTLTRHRMLLRPRPWGLDLHVPLDAEGQPLLPWQPDQPLDFLVRAGSDAVLQRTATGAGPATWGLPPDAAPGAKPQTQAALVSLPTPAPAMPRLLAAIHLAGLRREWLAAPPVFTLTLAPRLLPWVFYAITRRAGSGDAAIPDQPAAKGRPALRFKSQLLAGANTAGDPVGRLLLARHGDARCWRLVSARPVPVGGIGVPPLPLLLGQEAVIARLPTPPPDQVASGSLGAARSAPPVSFVYGVVHC